MNDSQKKVLHSLEAMCARREYCSSDIGRKALERCEGDEAAAAEIVESLKADRFVDDVRYASAFAREKASLTGWGPVKIRFALRSKRISDADIDAALSEVDLQAASDRLEKLLRAKWKTLQGDEHARLKLLKFALSRGYEYSAVESVVDRISHDG